MASKLMSNMTRTFSNSGLSRTYSTAPKPLQFTKLHQANMSPLPAPATQRRKSKDSRGGTCTAICCCCFTGCISMLITAAIALGVAALILWLVLRPVHAPSYDLHDLTLSRFLYTPATRALDTAFAVTFLATNPNGKIGIRYEHIRIDTLFMDRPLPPGTTLPGFYQGHRNMTRIPVTFATSRGFRLPETEGNALNAQLTTGSNVTLVLHVDVTAQLKIGAVRMPSYTTHVVCYVDVKAPVRAGDPATVACRTA